MRRKRATPPPREEPFVPCAQCAETPGWVPHVYTNGRLTTSHEPALMRCRCFKAHQLRLQRARGQAS